MMDKITEWCLLEHCRSKNGYFHLTTQVMFWDSFFDTDQFVVLLYNTRASAPPQVKSFGVVSPDPLLRVRSIRLINNMYIQTENFLMLAIHYWPYIFLYTFCTDRWGWWCYWLYHWLTVHSRYTILSVVLQLVLCVSTASIIGKTFCSSAQILHRCV